MTIEEILKSLKTDQFLLHCHIPMGYTPGLPIPTLLNGVACLQIPLLKYQLTGVVDQTRVFPPRYVVTVTVDQARVVGFQDLAFDPHFQKVNFAAPVGLFRHAAIRHLGKNEYKSLRSELFTLLDGLCASLAGTDVFDGNQQARLSHMYATVLEPSVKPFYHAIDKTFYETYLSKHDQQ